MSPLPLAFLGANVKPAVDAIDYGINTAVPLVQQSVFWFMLCGGLISILAITLLILQIRHHVKRNPPVSQEIDGKITACKAGCEKELQRVEEEIDERLSGFDARIEKLSDEIKAASEQDRSGRARIYDEIRKMRGEVEGTLRNLTAQGDSQERAIQIQGQMLDRLDRKLDAIREKL